MAEVIFRPKPPSEEGERHTCIVCRNPSTLEAVGRDGERIEVSAIRCCTKERCKRAAADIALIPFRTTTKGV